MAAPSGSTMTRPKANTGSGAQQVSSQEPAGGGVIPFLRGSGWGRYPLAMPAGSGAITLTTTQQTLGPIQVKAYDFMRSLVVECIATAPGGGSSVTTTEDGPWNIFAGVEVLQPNGQTLYKTSSGFSSAMIHAHGYFRNYGDPRQFNNFAYTTGSGTAPSATFAFRIPFELNLADALGDLPNKDANAPFQLTLTLNALSNVWGGAPTTPTFNVRCWLEAADQPPTMLDGSAVETTPPAMNTLQRWTEQPIAINAGQFDARVRKLGNYVRLLIPVLRRSASTRANGDADWPDPVQVVLDEDVKDNIAKTTIIRDIYERYGYGQAGSTNDAFTVAGGVGRWNGVFPIDYLSGPPGYDNGDRWLPTIESEDYILRGVYGNNGTMTMLVGEVLPQGNVFQ
jgi:hypothetical protein